MTICALLIARLSSTRLPQKNILPIIGKPMIQHLVERVENSKLISKVIITTSNLPSDDPLEELANKIGVSCYRGSLDNIMERIVNSAKECNCKTVVEILGDNPLVHSDLIDDVIRLYQNNNLDYAANITKEYGCQSKDNKLFSVGLRVQVYSLSVAKEYIHYPEYPGNGKHPCAYIFDNPNKFSVGYLEAKGKWSFMNRPVLNFAVNYPKNFDLAKKIYEKNYTKDNNFPLELVFEQLDEEIDLYPLFGTED
jgi:spore coat polysaccharide biosynthesis protein SpsF